VPVRGRILESRGPQKEARTFRKRLALVALAAVSVVAVTLAPGNSSGQSEPTPGLTYGGLKDNYAAWLRLDPGRRSIASVQIDWAIAPRRCSHRRSFSDTMYAGYEEGQPVSIGEDGTFRKTVTDRIRNGPVLIEETQTVTGKVDGFTAAGSITAKVRMVRPGGGLVRCASTAQKWRLVD
jgi:hypothetical protein